MFRSIYILPDNNSCIWINNSKGGSSVIFSSFRIICTIAICINCKSLPQTPSETRQNEIRETIDIVDDDKTIQPATKVLIRSTLSGAANDLKIYAANLLACQKENAKLINEIADMRKYYQIGKYSIYALYAMIAGGVAWAVYKVVNIFRPKI